MKLCQFYQNGQVHIGVLDGEKILDVTAMGLRDGVTVPASLDDFIAQGNNNALDKILKATPIHITPDEVKFAPVVLNPQKIFCAGQTFADHIKEVGLEMPKGPMLFSKLANTLNGHNCDVELIHTAEKYDYEAELVIVIGKKGKFLSEEQAWDYIFGYTCGNDMSVRDVQLSVSQYLMGKSFDGMCPLGPYVVTSDSIDVSDLAIKTRVNGETRQSSSSKQLIFSCAKLVSYASQYLTILPGDVILTGTPAGVVLGYPPEKQVWLKKGDVVEVEIEGIGILRNRMV